jgi:BlaI family transcriptional regulator, penicillinase repressor
MARKESPGDGARPERPVELGEAELAVLRVLWDHGPQTVRDVMQRLHERGRRVAYTTVLTFLARLEQKGCVASDKTDLAYVYKAKASRTSVTRSRVKALLEELYDGAAGPVVMHLVENERLTPDEIARLRKLIDDLDHPRRRG